MKVQPAKGVELRGDDIRIRFTDTDGKRQNVPLPNRRPDRAADIHYANGLVDDVRRAVKRGQFRWADFFPWATSAAGAAETVRDYGDKWLRSKGSLAAATLSQYGNALKTWYARELRPGAKLGDTLVRDVRHSDLSALVGGIKWPSARMRNNSLIVLRGTFDAWRADDRRNRDAPTEGIENARFQKGKPDPLTPEQAELVLARMQAKYPVEVWSYFEFAVFAFLRPEEEIAILWTKVDRVKRTVRIDVARTFKGTQKDIKTYEERELELEGNDRAWAALMRMRALTELSEHGHVFQNPRTKRPWHDERSQRDHYWAPTLKVLGIRDRRAYCTRHTGITLALMAGCDPSWVAHMAGHKNTKMIWEVYTKWIPGADKGAESRKLGARYRSEAGA